MAISDRIRRDIGTAHTLAAVIAAKLTPATEEQS
jgi:hypothetical protein